MSASKPLSDQATSIACCTIYIASTFFFLSYLQGKCDQYWPDDTSKFGAITVTLHKTETFADYVIRSLIVTKVGCLCSK